MFRLPLNGTTVQLQFSNMGELSDYMVFHGLLDFLGEDIVFDVDMGLRDLNDAEEEDLFEDKCYAFLVIAMAMTVHFGMPDRTHPFWFQHWSRIWDVCVVVVRNVPVLAQRTNHLAAMNHITAIPGGDLFH